MYKKMKIRITATVHKPAKATPTYAKIHQILIRGPIKYRQAAFIKGSGLDPIISHFTWNFGKLTCIFKVFLSCQQNRNDSKLTQFKQ